MEGTRVCVVRTGPFDTDSDPLSHSVLSAVSVLLAKLTERIERGKAKLPAEG